MSYVLSEEGWQYLANRMHGEDDGSWILVRDYTDRCTPDECVAIVTSSAGSLVVFLTHLAQVLHPGQPGEAIEAIRYLADQGVVHQTPGSNPTYYFPCVRVA